VNDIVIAKPDGIEKGNIALSVTNELHLLLVYVTFEKELKALKISMHKK